MKGVGGGENPSNSTVLMIKPNVGLTSFTSSFITHLTTVVFPALSRPLIDDTLNAQQIPIYYLYCAWNKIRAGEYRQHQNAELLIPELCFPENAEHGIYSLSLGIRDPWLGGYG